MSTVSLEAVDKIIAELCRGSSKDDLVPTDLDKMAFARALEDVRERYEMHRDLDHLSTKPQKKNSINTLNASAKQFRDHLSAFLKDETAGVELIKHAARQDSRLAAQEIEPLKRRQAEIKRRLRNEQLEEMTRTALLEELDAAKAAESKRSGPYRDEPHSPAAALHRLERDIDAVIRWTEILLKINEKPEPEEGSPEEHETGHLRFEGWQELPGDRATRWLVNRGIPVLMRKFFRLRKKTSRGTKGPGGPSIRFTLAVLNEFGAVSPKTKEPLSASAIEDYWKRQKRSKKASEIVCLKDHQKNPPHRG
ncbi:hypothetical protein DC522_14425 [Microvirga sp. KLBC 81]|uniref:hypothetical protein n=1 Tax=Microvirga sp. KLBC 81 TaxID=1862707 RepID=UPI000D50F37C|nr:hypothetical protein [Microvirga sp. KLBC 81]PVE23643.1 hypothetical protein DC522_14425 [Microvirga sp. KLBC 81]